MDQQNVQNHQSMHLVLSTDAKPRLKWTPELHQRFIEAITQLGGAEKATPKSLMRLMGIPGLTLYHLKSHLQKYRLGKSQQLETCSDNKQEDYGEIQVSDDGHSSREISVGTHNHMTESLKIAKALQMQMEVQKKLYEQIEVQRHLQLRIEAQGKYLQSVLKKAQETIAGYSSSSTMDVDLAKAELSQLVSIINNACPNSPMSELTETRGFICGERKQNRGTMCSLESSLTSSESSGRKEEEKHPMDEVDIPHQRFNTILELPLMDIHPEDKQFKGDGASSGRKRNAENDSVEQPCGKRCGNKLRKSELSELLDLNSLYQRDTDSSSKEIDLNCSSSFWGQ